MLYIRNCPRPREPVIVHLPAHTGPSPALRYHERVTRDCALLEWGTEKRGSPQISQRISRSLKLMQWLPWLVLPAPTRISPSVSSFHPVYWNRGDHIIWGGPVRLSPSQNLKWGLRTSLFKTEERAKYLIRLPPEMPKTFVRKDPQIWREPSADKIFQQISGVQREFGSLLTDNKEWRCLSPEALGGWPRRAGSARAQLVGTRFSLLCDCTPSLSMLLPHVFSIIPGKAAQFFTYRQDKRGLVLKRIRVAGLMSLILVKDPSVPTFKDPPGPQPGTPPCQLLLCLFGSEVCKMLNPAHI